MATSIVRFRYHSALRPGTVFDSGSSSAWDASAYDLGAAGLTCSSPDPAHNALVWADGSASGWSVADFSLPGSVMDFSVTLP